MSVKDQPGVERDLRWNFSVNVLDNMFFALAMSLVSRETILPLLVSRLTDSPVAVGLIPAIYSLCFLLPQLFVASHAERLPRKLPFVLLGSGIFQRLPYPLIGAALLLFAVDSPGLALTLFFAGIATAAFGGGVVTPAWFTMIGKVVPVRRRGIFFGLADGGGLFMGVIGAGFVAIILDQVAYPGNFSLLFLLASLPLAISWLALALTREPPSDDIKPAVPIRSYFRQLPGILRGHANYRRFLIAYALLQMSMMAVGFYIVYADKSYGLSGAEVGLLNAAFIGAGAILRLAFGWLGDRWGHKRNLALSAAGFTLAAAFALGSSSALGLLPAFICLALAIAADGVSHLSIVLEFATPADQPTYIGLTNTLLAPITFVSPVIGGVIAASFGIPALFAVSLVCGMLGAFLLFAWVREPRRVVRKTKP